MAREKKEERNRNDLSGGKKKKPFSRVYGQEVSAHVISTQNKNYNTDKYISWE